MLTSALLDLSGISFSLHFRTSALICLYSHSLIISVIHWPNNCPQLIHMNILALLDSFLLYPPCTLTSLFSLLSSDVVFNLKHSCYFFSHRCISSIFVFNFIFPAFAYFLGGNFLCLWSILRVYFLFSRGNIYFEIRTHQTLDFKNNMVNSNFYFGLMGAYSSQDFRAPLRFKFAIYKQWWVPMIWQ